ncbi:MAG: hypothetical protein DRP54_00225 [Spirochaetes bacterium]|nr:MAG: hypothetical protein DRP54_00225 [Spirochaetota bacterium]
MRHRLSCDKVHATSMLNRKLKRQGHMKGPCLFLKNYLKSKVNQAKKEKLYIETYPRNKLRNRRLQNDAILIVIQQ